MIPPIFTMQDEILIIESFMRTFSEVREQDSLRYRVYPLHQLFYDINEEAAKTSIHQESLRSIQIAE